MERFISMASKRHKFFEKAFRAKEHHLLDLDKYFLKIDIEDSKETGEKKTFVEDLEKLNDLGYPKIYYSIKSTHEYVDSLVAEGNDRAIMGFTTSTKTRPLIVAKLEEYVRNKLIKLNSTRLFHEFKTFIWYNGKPQAMRSYNDDLVMSLAIAC